MIFKCFFNLGSIHEKFRILKPALFCWSALVAIISLVDLALMILLAIDYSYWEWLDSSVESGSQMIVLSYSMIATGVMMTIALRGFAIWVINVIFVVVFLRTAILLKVSMLIKRYNVL